MEPESTVSVADALSTRPLIGYASDHQLFHECRTVVSSKTSPVFPLSLFLLGNRPCVGYKAVNICLHDKYSFEKRDKLGNMTFLNVL